MRPRHTCRLPASAAAERGNAAVYVLIVIALFGLLSFVLARQSGSEQAGLSAEQAEIYAGTIQQAAMQLKQSVEQMVFTGTQVSDLDFTTSDDTVPFNAPPHGDKVFHPGGGGVILPRIPDTALDEIAADPPARWYIGRFNNVEWTPTGADDVILTAHQIRQEVCERINYKLTGSTTIPVLAAGQVNTLLIDASESTAGANIEFTSAECASCYGQPALCIQDNGASAWSFYSIIAAE